MRVLGVCYSNEGGSEGGEGPVSMVCEYTGEGDLFQFLQVGGSIPIIRFDSPNLNQNVLFLAKIFIFGKKHQFWLKLDLYLSTVSIDKKFANEYVHIVHIQCHLSVDNTMTLNNTGVFQCCSIMPVFFRPSTHSY